MAQLKLSILFHLFRLADFLENFNLANEVKLTPQKPIYRQNLYVFFSVRAATLSTTIAARNGAETFKGKQIVSFGWFYEYIHFWHEQLIIKLFTSVSEKNMGL